MKLTIILILCSLSAHAQIIFQIGDKKASIVNKVTYDTAVFLSLKQMDNIMIELLKCDSISEVAKISDLQIYKYQTLVNTYESQINSLNAAQNTSNNYVAMLKGALQKETNRNNKLDKKIITNRRISLAASLVAVVQLFLLL